MDQNPQPHGAHIFHRRFWRVTVLTSMLFRIEFDPAELFEDRMSQIVTGRSFAKTPYTVSAQDGRIQISTADAAIWLNETRFRFSAKSPCTGAIWNYGDPLHNLGGTARTLDMADGAIQLEDGIFSEEGIGLLEDKSCVFTASGVLCSRCSDAADVYLFLYGKNYSRGLQDFYRLCGATPLLPRYALGNWWSRFWPYTQQEYLALMDRFESERLPFSVAVLDMDWHLTSVPDGYNSWTGYTWNRKLLPRPAELLTQLHARGKHVTLNLHPAAGVQPFEQRYAQMAQAMGLAPDAQRTIPFDFTDICFRNAYFSVLLHPMEQEGVDFWWIDWQQEAESRIPGLDPLWLLNHYHFIEAARHGKRPLILSRYAGPGSHRYPVGFSGDTVVSWESLRFQPYFTSTASNIGYGWWSHDIGGHMDGIRDDELICRWMQFGVFSPINRLHSTCNRFAGKEPWRFRHDIREIMGGFLRLRHQMIPYLYTMNHRCHTEGIPLIRPMYHGFPKEEAAYCCPNQYEFGSQMIVAPAVSPCCPKLEMAGTDVWLPPGTYYDFFTGVRYVGGRRLRAFRPLSSIPVFVRAGGIIPTAKFHCIDENPKQLFLRIYPGADGCFTMYEDDGISSAPGAKTQFLLFWKQGHFVIRAPGRHPFLPRKRAFTLCFCGIVVKEATVRCGLSEYKVRCIYDNTLKGSLAELAESETDQDVHVFIQDYLSVQAEIRRENLFCLLQRAQIETNLKESVFNALEATGYRFFPQKLNSLPTSLHEAIEEVLGLY